MIFDDDAISQAADDMGDIFRFAIPAALFGIAAFLFFVVL